jgi:hypothetical protein
MVANVPDGFWGGSDIIEVRKLGSVANKLPLPQTSFERTLYFRRAPFASVSHILNAVGE